MRYSLKELPKVFLTFLNINLLEQRITQSKHWNTLQPYIRSYLGNLLHFLATQQYIDDKLLRFTLTVMEDLIIFIIPFKKYARKLLSILIKIWINNDVQNVQIDAFLRIRQLILQMPPRTLFLEKALKMIYLSYVRASKFVNINTLPKIQFLCNCVVEIYQIDLNSSYQHAFVYIRQLAIHIRNAITSQHKESFHNIYNWQFINCLKVWAKLLCIRGNVEDNNPNPNPNPNNELNDNNHNKAKNPLQPLIYPFIQICTSVLNLNSSIRYAAMKFHILKILIELISNTGIYIPIIPMILQILSAKEFTIKSIKATKKSYIIRLYY